MSRRATAWHRTRPWWKSSKFAEASGSKMVMPLQLNYHTEIEQALTEQNHACVEISPSNR